MHDRVKVTITTEDGEVLDQFTVCHWRHECDDDEQENVGSPASESLMAERIRRLVRKH